METKFKGEVITREKIIQVLNQFDRTYPDSNNYDNWLDKGAYRYALHHNGRRYPCKYILSEASGFSTESFSGDEQTNRVFRDLGFEVAKK